jgi:hypothetical protein
VLRSQCCSGRRRRRRDYALAGARLVMSRGSTAGMVSQDRRRRWSKGPGVRVRTPLWCAPGRERHGHRLHRGLREHGAFVLRRRYRRAGLGQLAGRLEVLRETPLVIAMARTTATRLRLRRRWRRFSRRAGQFIVGASSDGTSPV